jgi:hypothetical protein
MVKLKARPKFRGPYTEFLLPRSREIVEILGVFTEGGTDGTISIVFE